ncbi:hypothetical protein RB195_002111 [Necator americanus]|uniref:Uncharacterized protein n=1 Tax=Necator americanus TaxID=51031 RepID=A0ABR1DI64_NECAM
MGIAQQSARSTAYSPTGSVSTPRLGSIFVVALIIVSFVRQYGLAIRWKRTSAIDNDRGKNLYVTTAYSRWLAHREGPKRELILTSLEYYDLVPNAPRSCARQTWIEFPVLELEFQRPPRNCWGKGER